MRPAVNISAVFHLLRSQPALASEVLRSLERWDAWTAAGVLAYRVGCQYETAVAALYRYQHPTSRVVGPLYFARNTGCRRQEGVLFGGVGPTWCGRWHQTQRALRWARQQLADFQAAAWAGEQYAMRGATA